MEIAENDTEAVKELDGRLGLHAFAVDERARRLGLHLERDVAISVREQAVLVADMRAGELDLSLASVDASGHRHTRLELVHETLGH